MAVAEALRLEVRDTVQQKFATARAARGSNPGQSAIVLRVQSKEVTELSESIIDLVTKSINSSKKDKPKAIAGSDVSLASTSSHLGNGGNASAFSRLSQGTDVHSSPQLFATMHWKPKEPPCYFGRNSEDVHTWTSLVRHYLTFMGVSDAQ